jgi:hypothetical protein
VLPGFSGLSVPVVELDVQNLLNRSRLSEEDKYALVDLLEADPTITMRAVSDRLSIPYPSVRMAFSYLGVKSSVGQAQVLSKEDALLAKRVLPLLKKHATFTEISAQTGYSRQKIQNAARRLGLKELVKKVREEKHGTAVEYGHFGCRCVPCKVSNTKRLNASYEDRKRRAATDAPHGTESGYRNWGCRCAPCCEVGAKANKASVTLDVESPMKNAVWSREEEEELLSYDSTARALAVRLGRTVSAVNGRRSGMWAGREPMKEMV